MFLRNTALIFVFLFIATSAAFASGKKPSPPPAPEQAQQPAEPQVGGAAADLYRQGKELSDQEKHQEALTIFIQANEKQPNDPDILNMLAHCQLKAGSIDESLANYKKALELRPEFPEAREYLGEAYLHAALREVETLKTYGDKGKEQLDDLSGEIKEAAKKL